MGLVKPIAFQQHKSCCSFQSPVEIIVKHHDPVDLSSEVLVQQVNQSEVMVVQQACIFHLKAQKCIRQTDSVIRHSTCDLEHHHVLRARVLPNGLTEVTNSGGPNKIEMCILADILKNTWMHIHMIYCWWRLLDMSSHMNR